MVFIDEKTSFSMELKKFAAELAKKISVDNEWTVRGFIDIFQNIYTISSDTKIVSKLLELHLFPHFLSFADQIGYEIELATCQNWYPDLTFINKMDSNIKFAVDLKTTYRGEDYPGFCNGFTLGSHGEYFIDRTSTKNIQYPYAQYAGHFCLGIIYSRSVLPKDEEFHTYTVTDISSIPAVIKDFTFLPRKNGVLQVIRVVAAIRQTSAAFSTFPIFSVETGCSPRLARSILMIIGLILEKSK